MQAFHAFLISCRPKISISDLTQVLRCACDYSTSIDGVTYRSPETLLGALLRLYAKNPTYFSAYFAELYRQLARKRDSLDYTAIFEKKVLTVPRDNLAIVRSALEYRLASRSEPISWPDYLELVRDSIDLGVNQTPFGLGTRFSKRMNSLLKTYIRSGIAFDETLSWLIGEVEHRTAHPEEYPRVSHQKERAREFSMLQTRLRLFADSSTWDTMPRDSLTNRQLAFEAAVMETFNLGMGELVRSFYGDSEQKARSGLMLYEYFLSHGLHGAESLLTEARRPKIEVPKTRFRHSKAGDPWDSADHWGWYF